jgi:predicted histidine transporter YuiF (NhaC family)
MFETLEEKSPDGFPLPEEKKFPDKANLISLVAGIVGSILVFVGNFLPVVDWANRNSNTFIKAFPVFGWLFIALAVVSFIILGLSKKSLLVFVGVLALSLLAYTYQHNQTERDKQIESGEDDYWTSIVGTSAKGYTERLERAKSLSKLVREGNFSLIEKESSWVWTSLFIGCLLLVVSGVINNNGLRKWLVKNFALYEPEKR